MDHRAPLPLGLRWPLATSSTPNCRAARLIHRTASSDGVSTVDQIPRHPVAALTSSSRRAWCCSCWSGCSRRKSCPDGGVAGDVQYIMARRASPPNSSASRQRLAFPLTVLTKLAVLRADADWRAGGRPTTTRVKRRSNRADRLHFSGLALAIDDGDFGPPGISRRQVEPKTDPA